MIEGKLHPRPNGPTRKFRLVAKGICFRLAAILIGLLALVVFELALRSLHVAPDAIPADPFVSFAAIKPLFVLDESAECYEIPKSRQEFFQPESFPTAKATTDRRVFCLGGSTVQGRPYAVETSFTTWLEITLQTADPRHHWDVVNCGGVSYASYRIAPVLEECLGYEPDLIVLYTGHNEFLEDREYGHLKQWPRFAGGLYEMLARLRTYRLAQAGLSRWQGEEKHGNRAKPSLSAEVEALLDYRGGLEVYHRDPQWQRQVIDHFQYCLWQMVRRCRAAGVPVLLINPVSNLADCPPFKSQHGESLSEWDRARFADLWRRARELYQQDMTAALQLVKQAADLDRLHAGIFYEMGKCYQSLGLMAQARLAFVRAKDLDVCPLRILEPMRQAITAIGQQENAPVLDAQRLFRSVSRTGIVGEDWLVDHIHPSIRGHQRIATAVAEEMIRQEWVRPVSDWRQIAARRSQEHLDSLGEKYYLQARERLRGLRGWAQGRAQRTRPAPEHTGELGLK